MFTTILHKTLDHHTAPRFGSAPRRRRPRTPAYVSLVIVLVVSAFSVVQFAGDIRESGGVITSENCPTAVADPWSPCGVDLPRIPLVRR